MGKFDGKTVLIAYAGGGIGKAAAEAFANEGATLIVHDSDESKLDGYPGEKVIGDLLIKEDADRLIQETLAKGNGRIDVLVNDLVIVELKTVEKLQPIHDAQLLIYLKLYRRPLGLLMNFNVPALRHGIKRLVNKYEGPSVPPRLGGD